ncbi:hypothetical protein Ahia01_001090600, partial [Argonauta hians]
KILRSSFNRFARRKIQELCYRDRRRGSIRSSNKRHQRHPAPSVLKLSFLQGQQCGNVGGGDGSGGAISSGGISNGGAGGGISSGGISNCACGGGIGRGGDISSSGSINGGGV